MVHSWYGHKCLGILRVAWIQNSTAKINKLSSTNRTKKFYGSLLFEEFRSNSRDWWCASLLGVEISPSPEICRGPNVECFCVLITLCSNQRTKKKWRGARKRGVNGSQGLVSSHSQRSPRNSMHSSWQGA